MRDFPEKEDTTDPFPLSITTDTDTQIVVENVIETTFCRYHNAVFTIKVTSESFEIITFGGDSVIEYSWPEILSILLRINE